MDIIKIPKDRIGVLIGPKGEVKSHIEKVSNVKLNIDSKEGDIELDTHEITDPLMGMKVTAIVRAIGRGFKPDKAYKLFSDDYYFHLIDIRDYTGKSPKHLRRIKARLIGKDGRTRELIEELSETDIVIYGHTVGIIADFNTMETAKTAVDMILSGSEHSTVYKFLEKKHRERRTISYIEGA